MKIKTPPRKIRTVPAKVSLQPDTPVGASPPAAALAAAAGLAASAGPVWDGRSSFFQIAAFLLREGGGVSPSTLECRPARQALGIAARRPAPSGFRRLCSKKLVYPDSVFAKKIQSQ